jgi:hypothetical protein
MAASVCSTPSLPSDILLRYPLIPNHACLLPNGDAAVSDPVQPTSRSRTTSKTRPRGSIAVEDELWKFVEAQKAQTGLTNNGVYRKALLALKKAEEDKATPAVQEGALTESDAAAHSGLVVTGPDSVSVYRILDVVNDKIARLNLLVGQMNSRHRAERANTLTDQINAQEPPEDVEPEYRALVVELAKIFVPITKGLIQAKVCRLRIHFDDIKDFKTFESIYADLRHIGVWDDYIWLHGDKVGGTVRNNAG